MEKECIVCGTRFLTDNPRRVYCEDCQKHLSRNRNEVQAGLRRIALADAPKTETIECENCGKSHEVFQGRFVSWRDEGKNLHKFCSFGCREKYIRSHVSCRFCGKLLPEGYYQNKKQPNEGLYCNKECYDKAHLVESTCQHCGKVFQRKKPAVYCSRECHLADMRKNNRKVKFKNDYFVSNSICGRSDSVPS